MSNKQALFGDFRFLYPINTDQQLHFSFVDFQINSMFEVLLCLKDEYKKKKKNTKKTTKNNN